MYAAVSSSSKDNLLRAIKFERPDSIPMTFHINEACWHSYNPDDLFDLMEEHKYLFPGFSRPKGTFIPTYAPTARKDAPYTDSFGCVWKTSEDGIVGSVLSHPIDDWSKYPEYIFPDPEKTTGLFPVDWTLFEKECGELRKKGEMVYGDLRHGHTFQQLVDLRGYENVVFDMADEEPLLYDLIEKIEYFSTCQIMHFIKAGVDIVRIPEDLGMQTGPMLSPANFNKYIKPCYQRMMKPLRDRNIIIHMHSDGNIRELCTSIIDGGVDVLNLQDLVNGIDWIREQLQGKICIDLDIDRQKITPFGTPEKIDLLVKEEVEKLSCREGGLMMIYGLYPGVPLKNVKALMDSMERYAFYYD